MIGGGVDVWGVALCTLILGAATCALSALFWFTAEPLLELDPEGGGDFSRGDVGQCGVVSLDAFALFGGLGSFDTASETAPPCSCGTLAADSARCIAAADGCVEMRVEGGCGRVGEVFLDVFGLVPFDDDVIGTRLLDGCFRSVGVGPAAGVDGLRDSSPGSAGMSSRLLLCSVPGAALAIFSLPWVVCHTAKAGERVTHMRLSCLVFASRSTGCVCRSRSEESYASQIPERPAPCLNEDTRNGSNVGTVVSAVKRTRQGGTSVSIEETRATKVWKGKAKSSSPLVCSGAVVGGAAQERTAERGTTRKRGH